MRLSLSPKAEDDIVRIQDIVAGADDALADRFLDDLDATLARIATFPRIGSPRLFRLPTLLGTRVWPVRNHLQVMLYYRERRGGIHVSRIPLGGSDPGLVLGTPTG